MVENGEMEVKKNDGILNEKANYSLINFDKMTAEF